MVEIGIIDDAIGYFDRGIAAEPDYATIYHNKGWLLNNIGRHTEAVRCFRKALELEPERAVTYDNLATLYTTSEITPEPWTPTKRCFCTWHGKMPAHTQTDHGYIKELEKKLHTTS